MLVEERGDRPCRVVRMLVGLICFAVMEGRANVVEFVIVIR